jgi:AraC-like DNA-binding protein
MRVISVLPLLFKTSFQKEARIVNPIRAIGPWNVTKPNELTPLKVRPIIGPMSEIPQAEMALPQRGQLLGRYVCLESSDVSEVAEKISWSRPHRIEPVSRRDSRLSRLSYVRLSETSIGSLTTNMTLRDRLGATDATAIVIIGIGGTGEHSVGGASFPIDRRLAAVHSPGREASLNISGYFEALSISVSRTSVVRELEKCLGRAIHAPIEFAPTLDMGTMGGNAFRQAIFNICKSLDRPGVAFQTSLAVRHLERSLATLLVVSHRHNYTRLMHRASKAGPWQVQAAGEFIHANAARPLSLGDLASVAGVSSRTLQYSFHRHHGISPMDFLRDVRLTRVREDLMSADHETTVSQVATRWGFYHFGRFAAAYRKRNGESPSDTLRRAKANIKT